MGKRLFAIVLALACTLGVMGLAACGDGGAEGGDASAGNAASASTASSAAASGSTTGQAETQEPAPTDEEVVTQDVDDFFKTVLGKDNLASILRSSEDIAELEQMGMDIDALAGTLAGVVKVEVESVKVSGDSAVAKVKMSMPDFSTDMDAKMQQALEDALAGQDPTAMGEEELIATFNQAMQAVLSDPELPTTSETMDIDYVRENGTWTMEDKDAAAEITSAMIGAIS